MRLRTTLIAAAILFAAPARAAEVSISASVEPASIRMGQKAVMRVDLTWRGSSGDIKFDQSFSMQANGVELAEKAFRSSGSASGEQRFSMLLTLKPLSEGKAEVLPFSISYTETGVEGSKTVSTPHTDLMVLPAEPPFPWKTAGIVAGIAVILGVSTAGAIALAKRQVRSKNQPPPAVPAGVTARRDLDTLLKGASLREPADLLAGGERLLRAWLEAEGLSGGSTRDLREAVRASSLPVDARAILHDFLRVVEDAKFGGGPPARQETTYRLERLRTVFPEKESHPPGDLDDLLDE